MKQDISYFYSPLKFMLHLMLCDDFLASFPIDYNN